MADSKKAGRKASEKMVKEEFASANSEFADTVKSEVIPAGNNPRDATLDRTGPKSSDSIMEKPKEEVREAAKKAGSQHRIQREFAGRDKEKTGGKSKGEKPKSETFSEETTFGDKKLDNAKERVVDANKKYQKAYQATQKKTYSMEKFFDEKSGLYTYKVVKTPKPKVDRKKAYKKKIVTRFAEEAKLAAKMQADSQIAQAEEDNSAVQAAHSAEVNAESLYEFSKNHSKSSTQRKYDKLAKAQKKAEKATGAFEKKKFQYDTSKAYEKWLDKNPHLKEHTVKNEIQKQLQKARIKRQYQKAARAAAQGAEKTAEASIAAARTTTAIAKKMQEIIARNAKVFLIIGAVALIFMLICTMFVSCGAMFGSNMSVTMASTYMSEPAEIDATDLQMTQLEMDLQNTIDNIETDYPDYDEYDYNLGEIGHDPFTLISYLSAKYPPEFTAADMESVVQALFDQMYTLTITPDTETRTRTVINEETGDEEEEEYEVSVLRVELEVKTLEEIAAGLTGEEKDLYDLYTATKGAIQQFESPVDYYWYNYVSSYYGYRKNPVIGANEFHRGIDIAVPDGSTVYATHAGTIAEAGYDDYYGNYVVITDSNGYTTKYGHLSTLNVSAGQTVRKGKIIGKTGNTGSSTGSHLHLECLYNGEYYNPYFYFLAGTQTMYGETTGGSGATDLDIPSSYSDAQVATLIAEAENYLGMDYVWGGSSPSTGFDCSGFVCWVFKNSGTYPLERTTANGIYNKCAHISPDEAQPGDIVFFQGTYNSGGPVSHVGIYCGNGIMIHCGDPIKYASINTSYWQSHFHSFGRLAR